MVFWCRDGYIQDSNKRLKAKTVYKDISFKGAILTDLLDKSNRIFKSFYTDKFVTEKELRYFFYDLRTITNLVNYMYYLKFISCFVMYMEDQ